MLRLCDRSFARSRCYVLFATRYVASSPRKAPSVPVKGRKKLSAACTARVVANHCRWTTFVIFCAMSDCFMWIMLFPQRGANRIPRRPLFSIAIASTSRHNLVHIAVPKPRLSTLSLIKCYCPFCGSIQLFRQIERVRGLLAGTVKFLSIY
jgi:hypothetical protein